MSEFFREGLERLRSFFKKRKLDRDFEDEVSSHIEMAAEENLRRGMSAEEARREALIGLGGVEPAKERHRDARGLPFLDSIQQDLRHTVRSLKRDRGFAIAAVPTPGGGTGATTARFRGGKPVPPPPPAAPHPYPLCCVSRRKAPGRAVRPSLCSPTPTGNGSLTPTRRSSARRLISTGSR